MTEFLGWISYHAGEIFFPERTPDSRATLFGRAVLLIAIAAYGWWFHFASMLELGDTPKFIHGINLIFHEAGHVIFSWFGEFMHVAGGTLGQLLMPAVLVVAFRRQGDAFGAALALWWFGQSLVDCAPYINDARSLSLQLLGGGTGREVEGHDWEYLLGRLDLMRRDVYISRAVLRVGRWIMAGALVWAAAVLAVQWRRLRTPAAE